MEPDIYILTCTAGCVEYYDTSEEAEKEAKEHAKEWGNTTQVFAAVEVTTFHPNPEL